MSPESASLGPRRGTYDRVLYTAFQLLISEGVQSVTANRLHQETGIARTTIYRHWPQPGDLIAAMLAKATSDEDVAPFVGQLAHDVRAAMDQLVFRFEHRPMRALFGALVDLGRDDPEHGDIAREYVDGLVVSFVRAFREAAERGELGEADPMELTAELTGPLFFRYLLLGEAVDAATAGEVLDRFLGRLETDR